MVYQNHKSSFFQDVEVLCKNPFLAVYFLFINDLLASLFLLSAAFFMLTIWPFGLPFLSPHCGEGHTRTSDSIGVLV